MTQYVMPINKMVPRADWNAGI